MKITDIEVVKNRKPIPLPMPWRPAWSEPGTGPVTSTGFAFYKVHTDAGIVGIGPCTGRVSPAIEATLIGQDPTYIQRFWEDHMRGRGGMLGGASCGGLEIALWDIVGKAAGMPVYKLLGAYTDKVLAYAATGQLKSAEHYIQVAHQLCAQGFKAIKLRMHRPDPQEDLDFVRAVCEAVGDEMTIMVDANQNNVSIGYHYWSRRTAIKVARELDDLGVYWLEEPLPRSDLEGLADLCDAVDMYIAGAEHCSHIYEFRDALFAGAYDIVQPDVILGHIGIGGMVKIAVLADAVGRMISPHLCSNGNGGFYLAATMQALGAVSNCPYIEYKLDPPAVTPETNQLPLVEPIWIDEHGYVRVPDKPGIGIEIDEEAIAEYL